MFWVCVVSFNSVGIVLFFVFMSPSCCLFGWLSVVVMFILCCFWVDFWLVVWGVCCLLLWFAKFGVFGFVISARVVVCRCCGVG